MLSERRLAIGAKAFLIELLQLWGFAQQPPHGIPEATVRERQQQYFRYRLSEAIARLPEGSELLAEVLEEILSIATGEDEIVGWRPPALAETLSRITEPLTSYTHAAKC
jgi:hypothetical protein